MMTIWVYFPLLLFKSYSKLLIYKINEKEVNYLEVEAAGKDHHREAEKS